MTTRPYSEALQGALALAGISDAAPQEVVRMHFFINRRCQLAYAESEYWPRWLQMGEERVVSEDGLLPYEEDGRQTIGTVLRVHATEPFKRCNAIEYLNFCAEKDGIQITGYQAREVSDNRAPMRVTGTFFPNLDGVYRYTGESSPGADGEMTAPTYQSEDIEANRITPSMAFTVSAPPIFLSYTWIIRGAGGTDYWRARFVSAATPDLATGEYEAQGSAIEENGGVTVAKIATYSAWVTYKAAMTTTYGTAEGQVDEIPQEWFQYVVYGASADFQRNDGRHDVATVMDEQAKEYLFSELAKIDRQGGSHVFTRLSTHSTRQAR